MSPKRRVVTRIDCHVHSGYSPDGQGTVKQIVAAAHAKGLDGVVITDHNTVRAGAAIKRLSNSPILVIPGSEVSTSDGHCLALGITKAVPKRRTLAETIEAIIAAGGVPVPSHPRRRTHGIGARKLAEVAKMLTTVEVYNAHDGDRKSTKAEMLAIGHRLGGTGGSDSHRPEDVGYGYTIVPGRVADAQEFLELLRRKKTWGEGVQFRRRTMMRKNLVSIGRYAVRGFRSI